jgi:DNA-binding GntR family transcriptional regulator
MMLGQPDDGGGASAGGKLTAASVLADRMAAALVHHEPGWRLPRLTALARRYNVSAAQVDAAIDELAARHLVRRLPDGQVYRASPAEYWIPIEGTTSLVSRVDPMGGQLICASHHSSRRRPPEDIARSLRVRPGDPVIAIRCLWTVGGEPAALSASYLPGHLAGAEAGEEEPDGALPESADVAPLLSEPFPLQLRLAHAIDAQPVGVQIEMAPPPPSAARSLRLSAGEPVTSVTVCFADPATGSPVVLTTAMLRPALFRVVLDIVQSASAAGGSNGSAASWTQLAQTWDA